jgi:ABC-2 type transport system permease protein
VTRRTLGTYARIAVSSARQSLAQRPALLGRCALYVLILLVFSRVWRTVGGDAAAGGPGANEMLWYLAVTEWIVIALPLTHVTIEADVRSGDIAYHLARPVPYVGVRLAEAAGDLTVRFVSLGVTGAVAAWLLAGGLPADPRGLVLAIPLGVLAGAVGVLFHAAIGLSSFWLQDASAVYWIWQKLLFVLGGMILPLAVYPSWLRAAAEWTPFAAMLSGPGRLAFAPDLAGAASTAALLALWLAVAVALLALLHRRGTRILDVNGG